MNRVTGLSAVTSSLEVGGGAPLAFPTGIAYDAAHDRGLVTTFWPSLLLGIGLVTGDRTILSGVIASD